MARGRKRGRHAGTRNSEKRGREEGTPSVHRVITSGKREAGRVVVVASPPSAGSRRALRQAQDRLSADAGRPSTGSG